MCALVHGCMWCWGCAPRVGVGGSGCRQHPPGGLPTLAPQAGCCSRAKNNCVARGVGCFGGRATPGRSSGDKSKGLTKAGSIWGSFAPVVLSMAMG